MESIKGNTRMTAVAKLPELPESNHTFFAGDGTKGQRLYTAEQMESYARAALSPAELGGVGRRKASDYVDGTYGPDDLAAIWNACCEAHRASTPRAAEAVDDAMVERYIEAYHYALADTDSEITAVRAGLAAALTQGE